MNEFSFIHFATSINDCDIPLPIKLATDVAFYTSLIPFEIKACDMSGERLDVTVAFDSVDTGDGYYIALKTAVPVTDGTCFVLRIKETAESETYHYSNALFYSTDTEFSLCEYYCNETQFGFEYGTSGATYPNKIRLPLRLHAVQYPQEEKIYVDGNGMRHLLTAKVDKDQELETEYLTDAIHEKIVVMLAHDIVKIEAIQVAKSAGYEIDHENEDELTCGTKIHKAKAKMIRNTTLKNTNC